MIEEIINSNNIFTKIEVETFPDLIKIVSRPLINNGDVLQEFPELIIKREGTFPTGLPTQPFGIAIPHTDTSFVNNDKLTIATLNTPISMGIMGESSGENMEVSIIFVLALSEANKQLDVLSKLMKIFQQSNLLEKIYNGNKHEIYNIMINNLNLEE